MAKVTVHREGMEDHGNDLRIERRSVHNHIDKKTDQPVYHWVVYRRQHTGIELHDEHKDHIGLDYPCPGVRTYPIEVVKTHGKHPVVKHPGTNEPVDTVFSHVWVPVFNGPEDEARAELAKLLSKRS